MQRRIKEFYNRGAFLSPANRFEKILIERDPEISDEDYPLDKTEFFKDTSRTIISYNDSPDLGFSASINPYRGCEHGCVYCYARPTHEYFGLSSGLDFESQIFVKTEAPRLLRKELAAKSWEPQIAVMSGITDCYQPIERKLKITRGCLEVLREFRNPVGIITKNHLVTRDIELFKQMAEYQGVCVTISVTSLDPEVARAMEPRAATPVNRIKAISQLAKAGIPVSVNVAPIVSGLTDHEIPVILKTCAEAGAWQAGYTVVRLPYAVKELFTAWLDQYFPDRKNKILNRLRELNDGKLYDSSWGSRMTGSGLFAEHLSDLFEMGCKRAGLPKKRIRLSIESFRKPSGRQMEFGF